MTRKCTKAIQSMVLSQQNGVQTVVDLLDKKPSTVYGELNPCPAEGRSEKLGLEDAFSIMDQFNDYSPLQEIMLARGFRIIPMNQAEPLTEGNAFRAITNLTAVAGELAQCIISAMEDGQLSKDELADIVKRCLKLHMHAEAISGGASVSMEEREREQQDRMTLARGKSRQMQKGQVYGAGEDTRRPRTVRI